MPTTSAAFQMNVARAARRPDEDYSSVIVPMSELSGAGERAGLAAQPSTMNPVAVENGRTDQMF
jgi:hypothetical protein